MSLQIPVQTGSRNEVEPGKSGFAHFFEHMMFEDEGLPARRLPGHLLPGRSAAWAPTTDDYTNYRDLRRGPREDPRDRGRPLPEPRLPGRGVQDRVPRRPRRVQQEQRQPRSSSSRSSARTRSRSTPTATRRWASSRTSRTCPTSSTTRRRSSTAGTGRSTRR
ncbi:MAG: hypothetical protein U0599_11850 [Vicinamibacteria bacterium]